jgi:hypothetical protein
MPARHFHSVPHGTVSLLTLAVHCDNTQNNHTVITYTKIPLPNPGGCKFCVYRHIVGGEVIYVGKGVYDRPFSFGDRTRRWLDAVAGRAILVEIVGWFHDELQALAMEKAEIIRLRPKANVVIQSLPTDPKPVHVIKLTRAHKRSRRIVKMLMEQINARDRSVQAGRSDSSGQAR